MAEVRSTHKHSRLLHKVEVVQDEPIVTSVPAVESPPIQAIEPEIEMGGGEMLGMSIEGETASGGKAIWIVAGSLAVLAGLVVGAVFYFSRTRLSMPVVEDPTVMQPTVVPTVTPAATITVSPTSVAVDLTKFKVQVLNGSGKKGEANVVAGLLEKVGFKDVATGNASKFDFVETKISYKGEMPLEVEKTIKLALSNYVLAAPDELPNPEGSKFDVVVVVGSKKSE